MSAVRRILFCVSALAFAASPAAAQSPVEFFGALSAATRTAAGTFTTDYVPVILSGGTVTGGSGGQTLLLQGGRPSGFLGGINVVGGRGGLQFVAARSTTDLGGANSPTHVTMTYLARQPPDYVEREFTYDRSTDWPDTSGAATLWQLGANVFVRGGGRRADFTLGGGLLFSRVSGDFDKASYVEFRMGGHSTLFTDEALARLEIVPRWHKSANAFGDLALSIGPHLALTAGLRWMPAPEDLPVRVKVLNPDQIIFEIPAERIQEKLGSRPAHFSRWGTPVAAFGLRVR